MRPALYVLCVTCVLSATGCQRGPDLDAYRAEILDLHQHFIQAHLEKDAATLAEPLAQDYLFVSDGDVLIMTPDEVEEGLARYLAATSFSAYEDVNDPIVGISRDGSLAWSIVQVRVAGAQDDPRGAGEPFDTTWAWITLYERRGDGWTVLADVSTNRQTVEVP